MTEGLLITWIGEKRVKFFGVFTLHFLSVSLMVIGLSGSSLLTATHGVIYMLYNRLSNGSDEPLSHNLFS